MEKSDIKALTFDLFGTILDSWGEPDALYFGIFGGEGCGCVGGSVLGSVAGTATHRTVSGHPRDAGA